MSSTYRTEPLRNVLAQSKSPYLLQHKDNPVAVSSLTGKMKVSLNSYQWQEFTPETIALAKQLDKPIFLSSGYSACHWSVHVQPIVAEDGRDKYLELTIIGATS